MGNMGSYLGFANERKNPAKMSEIIKNDEVVLCASNTSNGRRPDITMH